MTRIAFLLLCGMMVASCDMHWSQSEVTYSDCLESEGEHYSRSRIEAERALAKAEAMKCWETYWRVE